MFWKQKKVNKTLTNRMIQWNMKLAKINHKQKEKPLITAESL